MYFFLLYLFSLNLPCLVVLFFSYELGRNFVDPILLDVLPTVVGAGGSLAGASLTSKLQTAVMLPDVSSANPDVYVEYVPHSVP